MSDPGLPPTHEGSTPPSSAGAPGEDKGGEIPLWVLLAAVGVALVGGLVVAAALLLGGDDGPAKDRYPAAWDARVAPFVKIVEKQRGLTFLHPVAVEFVDPAKFEADVRTEQSDPDAETREQIRNYEGLFRALGLIGRDVDLLKSFQDAYASGTLAYYDTEDRKIRIRGSALTLAVRATLVHELTHALQDQQFSIGDRKQAFADQAEKNEPMDGESSVFDGIVEGDAERVADSYRASLSAAKRRHLAAAEQRDQTTAKTKLSKVPKVVQTLIAAPYTLGEAMTAVAAAEGGNKKVDALFRDTPTHDLVLLDPIRAILPAEVTLPAADLPKAGADEKTFISGEFGAVQWYLMLSERIPLRQALAAADGWGTDGYIGYRKGATTCARAVYEGRTVADTTRMYAALRAWSRAGGAARAEVAREGDRVTFESCDPGRATAPGRDASIDALTLATARGSLLAGLLKAGLPEKPSGCLAGKLIDTYSIAQITDPTFGAKDPSVQAEVRRLALSCR